MREYIDMLITDINSNKVYNAYYTLYFMAQDSLSNLRLEKFEYYMSKPTNRMKFLNVLNNIYTSDEMGAELEYAFTTLYPVLISQIFGSYTKYVYVPNDISVKAIRDTHNPDNNELNKLMSLIKYSVAGYIKYNQGHIYQIELPNSSKHRGKSVQFEIKDEDVPHLLGLTNISCGLVEWVENQLKVEYPNKLVNGIVPSEFLESNFLPYLLSHPKSLRLVNDQVNNYINRFRKSNPEMFDENGDLKPKFLPPFQQRFKRDMGFSYPLIDYNRILSKVINFLDLRSFGGIPEIIVDVDVSKSHDFLGCKNYLCVYRNSDIFSSDISSSKSGLIIDDFSGKFLDKFEISDNCKKSDISQKISLFGLKTMDSKGDVLSSTLANNTATTLNRLLYKYRMFGSSYYVDKVEDTNTGEIVYLSDFESEIDFNASNLLERKNIKQIKKELMQSIESFLNYSIARGISLDTNNEFISVIREKRPSLLPIVNNVMHNNIEVKKVS